MATTPVARISVELVHLAHAVIELDPPIVLENTPSGTRYIIGVRSALLEGERIKATMKGTSAGDWFTIGAEGTGTLDVRATLQTDDGALIYCHYNGRVDMTPGPAKAPIYAAPLFDTGDPRYAWLNKLQTVWKGHVTPDLQRLEYDLYELR